MTASWPPAHSLPRCSYLSHRIGRLLLPALGWKAIGPVPTGMPKAVLIAAPHTSNWDFVWALLASWYFGLKIRWLGKEALFQSPLGWLLHARRKLFGDYAFLGRYRSHPDKNQEDFFFGLLKECMEKGVVTRDMVHHEMDSNHVRKDAVSLVENVRPLEQVVASLPA